jgi:predicted Zn-dependent protease
LRSNVPLDWIEAQGAHAYDRAAAFAAQQDLLVPDSNAQAMRVHTIFNKLIPFALKWNDRAKDWHWEIALIKSPDIEALSLPGGKFVIDTGMLDRLGLNDDETAILIGHLMAHALREHARSRIGESLQAIEQAQGIPIGIASRGVEGNRVNIAPELLGMRYGADDETEADVIGADITSRAGFDPRAGLAYWQKIDRVSRWRSPPAFTAAHPISDKRLRDLKKRQKDMLELYAKAIGKSVDSLPPYREGKWNAEERGR